MYKFFSDNIGYVLVEPRTRQLIAIDMGESEVSRKVIEELEAQNRTKLTHIFNTHHHSDHIGGNLFWKEARPNIEIVTGSSQWATRIPGITK
jgi:hydroxyacylglutathione hydrolase